MLSSCIRHARGAAATPALRALRQQPTRALSLWELSYQIPIQIQDGMQLLQQTSGFPWWASIGLTTVAVRLMLLPVARKQVMLSEKFSVAVRDMVGVVQLYRNHAVTRAKETSTPVPKALAQDMPQLIRAINDVNMVHGTSFSGIILPTVLNAGVFITFVLSVRWMMYDPRFVHALQEGGMWWFQDLTAKDKLIYLPLAASMINYFSLELFFPTKSPSDLALKMKDGLQMFIIATFSAIVDLPSGVFMYWIPSGIFTVGQRLLFTNDRTRKVLGMGALPKPPQAPDGASAPMADSEVVVSADGEETENKTPQRSLPQ